MKENELLSSYKEILDQAVEAGLVKVGESSGPMWTPMMLCGCGKKVKIVDMPKKVNPDDSTETYIDNVCVGCDGNFPGSCVLICGKCKLSVGRIVAGTLPSGFVFRKGKVYHLDMCPSCTKGCEKSVLMEQALYERTK